MEGEGDEVDVDEAGTDETDDSESGDSGGVGDDEEEGRGEDLARTQEENCFSVI